MSSKRNRQVPTRHPKAIQEKYKPKKFVERGARIIAAKFARKPKRI